MPCLLASAANDTAHLGDDHGSGTGQRATAAAPGCSHRRAKTAYRVTAEYGDSNLSTVKGFDASVWVKRDGEWRCALHTEKPASH